MKKEEYYTDVVCKAMHDAGIRQLVKDLESCNKYARKPILIALLDIIKTYNCLPCDCLSRRISKTLTNANNSFFGICDEFAVKALIAELKTFLGQDNADTLED